MTRGLLWLPLLAIFIGLAWAGWSEYQKLESYKAWAAGFDHAKYDIYAVLGLKGDQLTWGKPTRRGPIELQHCRLTEVTSVHVIGDERSLDWDNPPARVKRVSLQLGFTAAPTVSIPFTEVGLAIRWARFLKAQGDAIATANIESAQTGEHQANGESEST